MLWLIFGFVLSMFPYQTLGFQCSCTPGGKSKDNRVLNIHLIPHSHMDPGWQTTFDKYYKGQRTTMAYACVKCIIDSVTKALRKNTKRRFAFSEISFLKRWWDSQTEEKREEVRGFVRDGRLYFVNGGWVVNDEAVTHYSSIIEQYTLGLSFIKENFGKEARPHFAWQIDPFGHSRGFAALAKLMGFDAEVINRVNFEEKRKRKDKMEMEMLWNLGPNSNHAYMFSTLLYDHYASPKNFCFDIRCDEMMDFKMENFINKSKTEVESAVGIFIDLICSQAESFRTNNIMVLIGDDFHYSEAEPIFKNMEIMIQASKQFKCANMFMSSPFEYLKAMNKENATWPVKEGDFFPYYDYEESIWTGYFTTRPYLKRLIRYSEGLLQGCKQIYALVGSIEDDANAPLKLRESVSLMQHHDAITGTSVDEVAKDYIDRLENGVNECLRFMASRVLGNGNHNMKYQGDCSAGDKAIKECKRPSPQGPSLFTVYNPLSWPINTVIRIQKPQNGAIFKEVEKNTPWPYQQESVDPFSKEEAKVIDVALVLPPLGFKRLVLDEGELSSNEPEGSKFDCKVVSEDDNVLVIGNGRMVLSFSKQTGLLYKITNLIEGKETEVQQTYLGIRDAGGAYVFHPVGEEKNLTISDVKMSLHTKGPLIIEVKQVFNEDLQQVVRLLKGTDFIEFDYEMQPSILEGRGFGEGISIVMRFKTDFSGGRRGKDLYTDSNGREDIARLTQTPELEKGFYPVPTRLSLQDDQDDRNLALIPDRSVGGASSCTGCAELMLYRKSERDDMKGLGRGIAEKDNGGMILKAKGRIKVLFGTIDAIKLRARKVAEEAMKEPIIFQHATKDAQMKMSALIPKYSFLGQELPSAIQILSVQRRDDGILVLLENILEKEKNNKAAEVFLESLFKDITVESAQELVVTGDIAPDDLHPLEWMAKQSKSNSQTEKRTNKWKREVKGSNLHVLIEPYEIKAYLLKVKRTSKDF